LRRLLRNIPQGTTEAEMMKIRSSTNFTIFLLFFGVATLEAFQTANWIKAAFWVAIGCAFLFLDKSYQSRRS